jgi:hypothetical protein
MSLGTSEKPSASRAPRTNQLSHMLQAYSVLGAALLSCGLWARSCASNTLGVGTEGGAHIGTIASHSKDVYLGSVIENFRKNHKEVLAGMEEITDRNTVRTDLVAMHRAVVSGQEGPLLKISNKYEAADPFLAAYFVDADKTERNKIQSFAAQHTNAAAVRELLQLDTGDKSEDVWPYRSKFLTFLDENAKNTADQAQDIWDSCPISKQPNLFIKVPGYGPVSKRAYAIAESPATKGRLRDVLTLKGQPLIGYYGDHIQLPDTYADEIEKANQCYFDKTGTEMEIEYGVRSAPKQCVVRAKIQGSAIGGGKCPSGSSDNAFGKAERLVMEGYRKAARIGKAAGPGESPHTLGGAIDVSGRTHQHILEECMPKYWAACVDGEDCGHWQPKTKEIQAMADDNGCAMVDVWEGVQRRFCFNQNPDELENELAGGHGYKQLPDNSLDKEYLHRVDLRETPHSEGIIRMSEILQRKFIEMEDEKKLSLQDVRDGRQVIFRYEVDDQEYFCIGEEHDGGGLNPIERAKRYTEKKATGPHIGCSTFRKYKEGEKK